jgi:hypothetical protein
MLNYNLRPEMMLKLTNVQALLTHEQKIALQWNFELTDLAALAKMMPSLPYSARLGLMPNAMALGFKGYGLFLSNIHVNSPDLAPNKRLDFKPELMPKPEYPKPRPHANKPRLTPENYPRPGYH